MHSRKKVPKDEAKEKERLQKASKFSDALTKILQMKKSGCKDRNLLNGIADLLFVSPDFYTLWNYRREIFISFKEELDNSKLETNVNSEPNSVDISVKLDEFDKLCKNELTFIENCLKVNYKSYGTWHHRYWLLTFMNEPNLQREIQLCNQFLLMDERNFHCWNYRRYVVQLANIGPEEELKFSSEKINENFSNFSSWYYRSSLLKILYSAGHDSKSIQSNIDEDYNRIQEAIYTDPTDQSVWLYLRWLFSVYSNGLNSLSNEKSLRSSFLQVKRFSWISSSCSKEYFLAVEFSDFVDLQPDILLNINGNPVQLKKWNSANGSVWYSQVDFDGSFEENCQYTFELHSNSNFDKLPKVTFSHSKQNDENFVCFVYNIKYSGELGRRIDSQKYQSLKDLLELEPDNKWLNFTLAWLESNDDIMNSIIDKLIQIDNLRMNFYKDLRSKIVMKKFISSQNDFNRNLCLPLSNLKLHSLRDTNQLMHICYLDLSHNDLIKLGITFSPLVSLRCLLLNSNSIYIVDEKLTLPNLTILSLGNNRISKWQVIDVILSNFEKLKHLVLFDNPILGEKHLDILKDKVKNRDLKIYLDRSNEANISTIIEAEFELLQNMHANEVMKIE